MRPKAMCGHTRGTLRRGSWASWGLSSGSDPAASQRGVSCPRLRCMGSLPKICCPWGSGAFQTVLDRPGGLQLSCLLRGCPADPVGASLADGVCLALALDAASKVTEQEWREKAKKDLEEWNLRQNEQMEKNRANNRYVGVAWP